MLAKLPGWVKGDRESVLEEVEPWRGTTPSERWQLAKLCAKDAIWAVRASGRAAHILAQVDPVPESTLRALARLREQTGWGRGHD